MGEESAHALSSSRDVGTSRGMDGEAVVKILGIVQKVLLELFR